MPRFAVPHVLPFLDLLSSLVRIGARLAAIRIIRSGQVIAQIIVARDPGILFFIRREPRLVRRIDQFLISKR